MAVESAMRDLGWRAAGFDLRAANPHVDLDGKETRSPDDYRDARVFVVVFTCNHCPYAKHVEPELIRIAQDYAGKDVQLLAINANDPESYPADSFEAMVSRAAEMSYPFPYLFDETQETAEEYGAACTPDIFVFGEDRLLAYRGRIDETRPGKGSPTGTDLRSAIDAMLKGEAPSDEQYPSVGCSIKWKQSVS